ncbi:uncharacterized protein LOC141646940 [Silene latifolia]|uniref:uncharacterized protein LOC141646940 n=1 Tax=Silene latifolia TaxID=37657 RepID=UPI003D779E00
MNNICYNWALCTNNSKHKGGRVWLLWNPQCYEVHIEDINSQTIHSHVKDKNMRKYMWASLKNYSGKCSEPWAIGGDFNNVLTYQERIGGEVTPADIQPFQDFNLSRTALISGVDTRKYSRLDRLLVNGWLQRFPEAFANFLPEGIFDHCPCVIDGTPMFKLIANMKKLKRPLKEINKENFHDIEHTTSLTLMALTQLQERLRVTPLDPALIMAEREMSKEYAVLLNAKHQFLVQKTKATWAIEGDDNTTYFHASLRAKRSRNKILGTSQAVKSVHKPTIQKGRVITIEHHEKLLRKVTAEEIRLAMFSIPGTKAPGPDGYSSQFFKDTWSITGTAVCAAIMDLFENGKLLKQVKNTVLTLVPKVDMPLSVTQFRPIACCNTVYKCIVKLLCNRLSEVLPLIISPNQSDFVKGRDIVENILVCQDLVKLYGRKACSPRLLMKIYL